MSIYQTNSQTPQGNCNFVYVGGGGHGGAQIAAALKGYKDSIIVFPTADSGGGSEKIVRGASTIGKIIVPMGDPVKQYASSADRTQLYSPILGRIMLHRYQKDGGLENRGLRELVTISINDTGNERYQDDLLDIIGQYVPLDFRFLFDGDLERQSGGNLITGVAEIEYGIQEGFDKTREMIGSPNVRCLPITLNPLTLKFETVYGRIYRGEHLLDERRRAIQRIDYDSIRVYPRRFSKNGKNPEIQVNDEAVSAIEKAGVLIFGGTSHVANTLAAIAVPEIKDAVRKSSAKKVYIANIATEPQQTAFADSNGTNHYYGVYDHVASLEKVIDEHFDYVLVHDHKRYPIKEYMIRRYHNTGAQIIRLNGRDRQSLGNNGRCTNIVEDDFVVTVYSIREECNTLRTNPESLRRFFESLISQAFQTT